MLEFIEDFIKNHVWGFIAVLIGLIGIVIGQYYLIQYRLPDIEKSVQENKTLISTKLDESSKNLAENVKKQDERIIKVESGVSSIKLNLLVLMRKVGKPATKDQLKELASSTNEYGVIKAASMSEAKFISPSDKLPSTKSFGSWASVALNLGMDVPNEELAKGTQDPKYIQSTFTRALVSDNPQWGVVDNKLMANYKDGAIAFTPKDNVSPEELHKLATELNTVKDNLGASTSWRAFLLGPDGIHEVPSPYTEGKK